MNSDLGTPDAHDGFLNAAQSQQHERHVARNTHQEPWKRAPCEYAEPLDDRLCATIVSGLKHYSQPALPTKIMPSTMSDSQSKKQAREKEELACMGGWITDGVPAANERAIVKPAVEESKPKPPKSKSSSSSSSKHR
ncbi:hypothetical protein CERZMDRAFT_94814 [Cercospora zeae-maydis SCOH1-5]|uniref:Uncharacterized protein n=1 Tax=Cercospora zeae-maydis SCOH1-5 TaxID=717836 RepID=A0A6A6FPP1_9PEZI|nr:hypothetical protein CERZMDRAFT_94814 [Cercospora zeae-maydis SCOH1-5]